MPRTEDPWYVVFRDVHQEIFDAPYQYQTADFVRLAALKKSLKLANGSMPETWKETCRHYLETPQGKLTLADMCSRYGIFKRSSLNQFNRPDPQTAPVTAKPKERVEWREINGKQVAYKVPIV